MNIDLDGICKASGSLDPKDRYFAPGLARRARKKTGEACYWLPTRRDIADGYRPKSLTFPSDLTELELAERCRAQWADLVGWREGREKDRPTQHTMSWLIDRYLGDRLSPFQKVTPATAANYRLCCEQIRRDVGRHLIGYRNRLGADVCKASGEDILELHEKWSSKTVDGKTVVTPSRARHLIVQLRELARYAVIIAVPGAKDFKLLLSSLRFPTPPARTERPEPEQVMALVKKAIEKGWRSIAIATLAQFEFTERRKHIIGECNGEQWSGGWDWRGIDCRGSNPQWTIRYQQTKRGIKERVFDLRDTPLLLSLIQQTPAGKRIGPVIICETTGRPWRRRYYAEMFREIARAAGVPDSLWSMDMRAGGATEVDSLPGITERDLMAAGGWSDPAVANKYSRAPQRRAQNIVRLRQKQRTNETDERMTNEAEKSKASGSS